MPRSGVPGWITLVASFALSGVIASGAHGADAARLLVVLRASEQPNHIYVWGGKNQRVVVGRTFGEPSMGRDAVEMLRTRVDYLNDTFKKTIASLDRDTPLAAALAQAFAEQGGVIEITPSTAADRYLQRGLAVSLTDAPRVEGFHFVLALNDDFAGLATLDEVDAVNGILTPAFDASYALYDVANGEIRARGKVSSSGYLGQPYAKAATEPALFGYLWPYLCGLNATNIVDQLLRADHLHVMAERVGRGAEQPPVAAKLADLEQRIRWELEPAGGWHEVRTTAVSRLLEPVSEQRKVVRITFDAEFLIPELRQGVRGIDDYLPIYDRKRLRAAPKSGPLEPFADITAGDYRAYRYVGQAGETDLVLFRATEDGLMRIVTVSIADNFAKAYPKLRPRIERMLSASSLNLAAAGEPAR
jgi:hypothetical protein